MYPVNLANPTPALLHSAAEPHSEPLPESPQAPASLPTGSAVTAFIAQNGAHPILSGLSPSPATHASDAKSAQTALLRDAQAQMRQSEQLHQQENAAEAHSKAKSWSILGAVVEVVVAAIDLKSTPNQGLGTPLLGLLTQDPRNP